MKHKLLRSLLALVLVCCMIVNCIAIKAEASVLGGTALALFGDDAIAVIAACIIGLGVIADTASQTSMLEFRYLCDQAYDAMAAAGEWVVDGAVTVYNCATELWDYGVDCGMVQWLHDWIFDSQVVGIEGIASNPGVTVPADALATAYAAPYSFFSYVKTVSGAYEGSFSYVLCYSYESPIIVKYMDSAGNGWNIYMEDSSATAYYYATYGAWNKCTGTISAQNTSKRLIGPTWIGTEDSMDFVTSHDISLGVIAPPGTDIQTEYGEYIVIVAPNGVPDTGGDGSGDDEQPQIPIIPVPIMPSYEETIQLPQEDIWKGNKVETEDPDTGGSTDPSTGTDTDPDSGTDTDGSIANTPWETFKKWISTGWESTIQAIPTPESIAEAVGNVIKSIFVPDADFITEKWNDIRSRFEFADSITATGEVLVNILDGLDPEPPVSYIDLGATEGSYNIGGEVAFIDLRWYARYKPTMDLIISAFLWLAFVWRLILKLPGIISGMPGEFVLMNLPVNLPHLGIGSGQRREELEPGRNNRRLGDGH